MLLNVQFLCSHVYLLLYARLGFAVKVSCFDAMSFIHMFMHDAISAELLQGKYR